MLQNCKLSKWVHHQYQFKNPTCKSITYIELNAKLLRRAVLNFYLLYFVIFYLFKFTCNTWPVAKSQLHWYTEKYNSTLACVILLNYAAQYYMDIFYLWLHGWLCNPVCSLIYLCGAMCHNLLWYFFSKYTAHGLMLTLLWYPLLLFCENQNLFVLLWLFPIEVFYPIEIASEYLLLITQQHTHTHIDVSRGFERKRKPSSGSLTEGSMPTWLLYQWRVGTFWPPWCYT